MSKHFDENWWFIRVRYKPSPEIPANPEAARECPQALFGPFINADYTQQTLVALAGRDDVVSAEAVQATKSNGLHFVTIPVQHISKLSAAVDVARQQARDGLAHAADDAVAVARDVSQLDAAGARRIRIAFDALRLQLINTFDALYTQVGDLPCAIVTRKEPLAEKIVIPRCPECSEKLTPTKSNGVFVGAACMQCGYAE